MSDLPVVLPPYIVLKSSDNKYLVNDSHQLPQPDNNLVCTGEDIFSKYAKLEVVSANVGEGRVHLRCCYNKKYLRVFSQSNSYIYALADEPEEDTGTWACTLFEPLSVEANNPKRIRLRHVQRGNYACYWKTSEARRGLVTDYSVHDHQGCDIYTVTDWESLVVLPKHVAFKGDNGKYMSLHREQDWLHWYVVFDSIDKGNPAAWFEVTTTPDGYAQIRSHEADDLLLWTDIEDTYITGRRDENASKSSRESLFWPVKIDNKNTVALRSALNNKICTRVGEGSRAEECYLHALHPTVVAASHLKVEELVLNRRIYNPVFHLDQAVIYGQTPISMATARNINNGTTENTVAIPLSYTQSQSSTWNFAQSTTEGISAGISIGIPEIGLGGEISVSRRTTQSYEWGSTITNENTIATTYTVLVAPGESVSVSLLATKGYCDVPFSYFQRDILYTGETVIYKKDDGLFTGVNAYDFQYETDKLSLTPSQKHLIETTITGAARIVF
ncbi:hypothetical protein M0R45_037371 [Rubus argutus]|uniref:Agglutinin domain-containing protein n=1 Tax=Rubus argutus TaxID=59490 RepID=A0AAW1VYY0_RUBAR